MRNNHTLHLAVIGDPIAHSKSPAIHSAVMEELRLPYRYSSYRVKKGELPQFLELVKKEHIDGFNITMPHKTDIIPFLDEIDREAQRYQSVNTVKVENGRLYGYSTDADGYAASLRDAGFPLQGKRVVFLGAGGVVNTLARKAAYEGAANVAILNRTEAKAKEICALISAETDVPVSSADMSPESLCRYAKSADILINATPLGMHGIAQNFADLSFVRELREGAFVSDLIYNPAETLLLKTARERGLATLNGLGMLLYQAFLADEIYTGINFDFAQMKKQIEAKI